MPFIVQCPHPSCKKFLLMEDTARGTRVDCLICKKTIEVEGSVSGDNPAPPLAASGGNSKPPPAAPPKKKPPSPAAGDQKIVKCTKCAAQLRIPPDRLGKPIKCSRCKHVFTP